MGYKNWLKADNYGGFLAYKKINHIFRRHIKKLHCVDTIRKTEIWLDKFDELYMEHQKRMLEWYLLTRSGTSINNFINSLDFDNLYPKNGN